MNTSCCFFTDIAANYWSIRRRRNSVWEFQKPRTTNLVITFLAVCITAVRLCHGVLTYTLALTQKYKSDLTCAKLCALEDWEKNVVLADQCIALDIFLRIWTPQSMYLFIFFFTAEGSPKNYNPAQWNWMMLHSSGPLSSSKVVKSMDYWWTTKIIRCQYNMTIHSCISTGGGCSSGPDYWRVSLPLSVALKTLHV